MKTFLLCVVGAFAVLFAGAAVIQYQNVIKNLSFDQIPVINTVLNEVSETSVVSTTRSILD